MTEVAPTMTEVAPTMTEVGCRQPPLPAYGTVIGLCALDTTSSFESPTDRSIRAKTSLFVTNEVPCRKRMSFVSSPALQSASF